MESRGTEYFTLQILRDWLSAGESPLKDDEEETRYIMGLFLARAKLHPEKGNFK